MAQHPLVGQGVVIIETSRSHLCTSDDPDIEALPDTTQYPQETNVHVSGGIRTQSHSKRKTADPRLRLLGHWDRHKHT
jgi:hypothetical protein